MVSIHFHAVLSLRPVRPSLHCRGIVDGLQTAGNIIIFSSIILVVTSLAEIPEC